MKHSIGEKYKNLKNKMSFGTRLFVAFFSISIPLMIVISVFLYISLEGSSRESVEKMMMQVIERTKNQIEYIFSETEYLSRNIIYDEDVQQMLKEAALGNPYPEEDGVKYFINSFIVNREYMDSVVLVGNESTLFSTEKAMTDISSMENITSKWWYEKLDFGDMPFQWFSFARSDQYRSSEFGGERIADENSMMLTRLIRSTDDYKTHLGRMMIYISNDYIKNIWSGIQWGDTLNVWIVGENGQILFQNETSKDYGRCVRDIFEWAGSQTLYSNVIKYSGQSYVVGMERFENHDWSIVMAVPLSEVHENPNMIWVQIGIMVLMTFVLMICTSFIISKNVSRPVECISEIMDSYHDHSLKDAASEKERWQSMIETFEGREDEIGKIYRSYDQMVNRVDHMIKEIYLKDLEKKDAELALMQSQINPHFLYNTLDSINWLAMMNEQDEISEMVTALSDTFRLSLKKSNSPYIKIAQEMEYIESYMTLQKIRFGDRLHFEADCGDEVKPLYMLRFVLQPIIENAIKHGIRTMENGGSIDICFKPENDRLIIDIINDGADIDLEQMREILNFDVENDTFLNFKQNGYGLQNIHRRIKIVHGGDYGLAYDVLENQRTLCRVILPVINKDVETDEYTNKYAGEAKEDTYAE